MGTIGTSIKLNDQMSPALKSIYTWLDKTTDELTVMKTMLRESDNWSNGLKTASDRAKGLDRAVSAAAASGSAGMRAAGAAANVMADGLSKGQEAAERLNQTLSRVIGVAAITKLGQTAVDWIQKSTDAFAEQASQVRQLQTTLRNMIGGQEAADAFGAINQKATDIENRGMFSAGAMTAGAGELATYFTDPEAITSMMDTLADYAAGMSGGQAVSAQQMTDYATGLAKVTTGAYDAMTKKGFQFTEAQKAVVSGTADQIQLMDALGDHDGWEKMTDDMRVAAVMADIIGESWSGLYEQMSNTPTGKLEQLKNQFDALQESVGQKISGSMMNLYTVASQALSSMGWAVDDVSGAFNGLINIAATAINAVVQGATWVHNNWSTIRPVIEGATAAVIAYKAACLVASAATALISNPIGTLVSGLILAAGAVFTYGNAWSESVGYSSSALGTLVGAIYVVMAAAENTWLVVQGIFAGCVAVVGEVCTQIRVGFHGAITYVRVLFYNLLITVLGVIEGIIDGIASIPGAEQAAKVMNWDLGKSWVTNKTAEIYGKKYQAIADQTAYEKANPTKGIGAAYTEAYDAVAGSAFEKGWAGKAYREGAAKGDVSWNLVKDKLGLNQEYPEYNPEEFDYGAVSDIVTDVGGIADSTGQAAKNSGAIKDKLSDTDEDIKYLIDIAEREAINRFTTADINVTMTNTNQISSQMDIEDVIGGFAERLNDAMVLAAEGV